MAEETALKKQKTFSEFNFVWRMLKHYDNFMGYFVMTEKLNSFQRIYHLVWIIGLGSPIFLGASTAYTQPSDLALLFQSVCLCYLYSTVVIQAIQLLMNKEEYMMALTWIREAESIARDNVHMKKAVTRCVKFVKYFFIYFLIIAFGQSLLVIIIGQLLPDSKYPKFKPPQPFVLPVEDQDNWTIYLITCTMQTLGLVYGGLHTGFYYCMFSVFCIIYFAKVEIILEEINNLLPQGEPDIGESSSTKILFVQPQYSLEEFDNGLNSFVKKYCDAIRLCI